MIPVTAYIAMAAAAGGLLLGFGAGYRWQAGEVAQAEKALSDLQLANRTDESKGEKAARASGDLADKELSEKLHDTALRLQAAQRDAAGARHTAGLLRDAAVRIATARDAASDPAADAARGDAAGPGLVSAKLLLGVAADVAESTEQLGRAGADLAEALALARVANGQCRAEHDIARASIERVRAEVKP